MGELSHKAATIASKAELKDRIQKYEAEMGRLRQQICPLSPEEHGTCTERIEKLREKVNEYYNRIRLYEVLVERYSDYIEENETQTIQDLKRRVNPRDESLADFVKEIRASIPDFDEARDMEKACNMAFSRISEEIESVPSIDINFWLTLEDMMAKEIADYEDKAILVCAAFRALGADAVVVVADMVDGSNRPLVLMDTGTQHILLDPNDKHPFDKYRGSKQQVLSSYLHEGVRISKVLYEFNDQDYKQNME